MAGQAAERAGSAHEEQHERGGDPLGRKAGHTQA